MNIIFPQFLVPSVQKWSFSKILLLGKVEQVDLGKVERFILPASHSVGTKSMSWERWEAFKTLNIATHFLK